MFCKEMPPRVLEILDRLESIDVEAAVLRKELRKVLEEEEQGIQDDFSMFKETTNRLLTEFLCAPNHMLSYDDIKLDIIFDEDASDSAVRSVIKRARIEMRACPGCRYEIKSIPKWGYKLERTKIVSNCVKYEKNSQKKSRKK